MKANVTLVRDNLGPSLLRYADVMQRTLAQTVKRAAKGVTRRVMAITQPASQGSTGADAYRAGRARIGRQMSALLAPVKLKGRRLITTVFGRKIARPVYVKTREKFPDVAGLYRQNTRALESGVGIRLKNFRGKKFYVDQRKFKTVLQAKQKQVGALASGWLAAANLLDVPVQQFISRHGAGRGTVKMNLITARMQVTVVNYAPGVPPNIRAEVDRRIVFAIEYQRAAMLREVDYMVVKQAQSLAIKTRNMKALVPEGMAGGGD